jgi:hypothetical protein
VITKTPKVEAESPPPEKEKGGKEKKKAKN